MIKIYIITLSCLLLFGCQATVNTVENEQKSMQVEAVDTTKVSTDTFLKNRLEIVGVDKRELDGGLFKVQVTARNVRTGFWAQLVSWFMGDSPYQIAYRFTWLDINGMQVDTATSTWIPIMVIPGDTVRLNAVSPNPRCRDFTLSIRENEAARS
ncbi:hypothetical protein AU255_07195 [Methyloprofundus sedimenti]|uniref:DUF1425 domain-containing protein n=1 Tax=Methyloprofundus sedimenti TaxID=1420851 RepID=A0A1V8M8C0_9GAMM|nr:DUF1425 domain-containing protein [Methyloprofundus sedimenti]OQK17643.1 hypothetical protein AU255_07195 [Methyloprofundus sedimenti]